LNILADNIGRLFELKNYSPSFSFVPSNLNLADSASRVEW